jgi:putative flavoprotein involved in K+ transport
MSYRNNPESIDTVVIGAGQAGLSVGYHLSQHGLEHVLVDAGQRIGDSWRNRWDSLRLFTSGRYDGLDGFPFPASPSRYPTKDEMADYLEAYAERFQLPVRLGFAVDRLSRANGRYMVASGDEVLMANNVVVAMGDNQVPRVPGFAQDLDPGIYQIESIRYRRPSQLPPGDVLVVGAGNSGAEIALDLALAGDRQVWLSGRHPGHVPVDIDKPLGRHVVSRFVNGFLFHRLSSISNPIGRRLAAKMKGRGKPLVRRKPHDLDAAGVHRVGRTVGTAEGQPVVEDADVGDIAALVWASGFRPGFDWIDDDLVSGEYPDHTRGVVSSSPGLYFVGLEFTYAISSGQINGVGRDAAFVCAAIARRRVDLQAV